ncbi:cytochrome P450 [Trichophaea hybrida]|nr:cytochrome P450 [Trichophaea hybrida]
MTASKTINFHTACLDNLGVQQVIQAVIPHFDVDKLELRARAGTVVGAVECSNFYAFDVMGAVGSGKLWGMLGSGELHEAVSQLHSAMVPLAVLRPVSWLLRLATDLPGANKPMQNFMNWCWNQLSEKKKNLDYEGKPKDVMTWILTDSMKPSDIAVNEDSCLMIIAGSDTTDAALANALYFLLVNPHVYKKLQNILDDIFPGGDGDFDYSKASSIPFLDGIIHETLRLQPSVPAGLTRITQAEGLTIDDVYIPGDVVVNVPGHTIQRDERYYEKALEFIPERWTEEKAEMIKDKRAYAPFSLGTYGCVGKGLAMMELRMAIADMSIKESEYYPEDHVHDLASHPLRFPQGMTL